MRSAPIISFEYLPSAVCWRLARLLALLAGICPWLSASPGWACILADGWLVWAVYHHGQWRNRPGRPLVWLGDSRWLLDAGRFQESDWVLRRCWRWGPWMVLELAARGRRCGLWLGPDNVPAEILRRLRARVALSHREVEIQQRPLS